MRNAFYFQHDYNAHADEKLIDLWAEHSWQGYGLYWRLLELLAENNGYLEAKYKRLAALLHCSTEVIRSIIEDYGLFQLKDNRFFSNRLLEQLQFRENLSKAGKRGAENRWGDNESNGPPNGDPNGPPNGPPNGDPNGPPNGDPNGDPNGKGKERKGKETKEKETKEETASPLIPEGPTRSTAKYPHYFSESAYYYAPSLFKREITQNQPFYKQYDLDYYYNAVINWSASKKGKRKKDWIATARNFILNDYKRGQGVLDKPNDEVEKRKENLRRQLSTYKYLERAFQNHTLHEIEKHVLRDGKPINFKGEIKI